MRQCLRRAEELGPDYYVRGCHLCDAYETVVELGGGFDRVLSVVDGSQTDDHVMYTRGGDTPFRQSPKSTSYVGPGVVSDKGESGLEAEGEHESILSNDRTAVSPS
jgi:hypothetical protein